MKDSEIMQSVIDAVGINAYPFSLKLGYKSHATIYHILNGQNNISDGMTDRIIKAFPNVNRNFIKKAELPIILDEAGTKAQMNLFNIIPVTKTLEFDTFQKFMEIPGQLDRIEAMLLELLGKDKS